VVAVIVMRERIALTLHPSGKVTFSAPGSHLHVPPACRRTEEHERICDTFALTLIVAAFRLSWLGGQRSARFTHHLLVETHHRAAGIKQLCIRTSSMRLTNSLETCGIHHCFLNHGLRSFFKLLAHALMRNVFDHAQFHQSFGWSVQRACPAGGWLGHQRCPPVSVQAGAAFAAWLFIQGALLDEPLTNALHCGQSDMRRLRSSSCLRSSDVKVTIHFCVTWLASVGIVVDHGRPVNKTLMDY
jgi:hypothetical protein